MLQSILELGGYPKQGKVTVWKLKAYTSEQTSVTKAGISFSPMCLKLRVTIYKSSLATLPLHCTSLSLSDHSEKYLL